MTNAGFRPAYRERAGVTNAEAWIRKCEHYDAVMAADGLFQVEPMQ